MHDLTGFQRDLLFVTAGLDEPNGLDIKDELEDYYGTSINHGRLYPNLDTLCEKGLIDKQKQDERTNAYSLTGRGRREILDRESWEHQYIEELVEEEAERKH
ncbi:helix-turn-helix transcriptional regulator [Halarchaeum sp. P4]|uniref:helix-turn-helix transcriptional regulator n=1 Tax=Halarchaeum sp. P4 TaxID=3421639 RepID=UPI003EB8C17C